jgi:hypothetical protein
MKIKGTFIKAKASEGHQNIVITKYIKPTQGRSSKQGNKIIKSVQRKRRRRAILWLAIPWPSQQEHMGQASHHQS